MSQVTLLIMGGDLAVTEVTPSGMCRKGFNKGYRVLTGCPGGWELGTSISHSAKLLLPEQALPTLSALGLDPGARGALESCIRSFIYAFNKHLLSACCVPGTEFTKGTGQGSLPLWSLSVGGHVSHVLTIKGQT